MCSTGNPIQYLVMQKNLIFIYIYVYMCVCKIESYFCILETKITL